MKKIKKNIILLFIVGIIVLILTIKENFVGILEVLLNSKKIYILVIIIIMLTGDLIKSIAVSKLVKQECGEYKYKDGFFLALKTNFFNGITPFSLGGQPYQVYYLKKKYNIDYVTGTNIIFKDFYSHQMSLVILSIICLVLNSIFEIARLNIVTIQLLVIGLIINFSISGILIYLPYSKKNGNKIISLFIGLLSKLKIVKDKDNKIATITSYINKFKNQINQIVINPRIIFSCIFLNMLKLLSLGVATYFCFKSIDSNITLLTSLIIYILIMTMASFVPIPGASGGMEFGFMVLFSYYVIDAKLGAVMIIWRFFTYYLPLIYGGIIFGIENKE